MVRKFLTFPVLLCAVVLFLVPQTAQSAVLTDVDLELTLLVDSSGSIDNTEWDLQVQGYANAFKDATVISKIQSGYHGSIAVTLLFWSSANEQTATSWYQVNDAASGNALAAVIEDYLVGGAYGRPYSGLTSISGALDYAANSLGLDTNMFLGTRALIDISGDGTNNDNNGLTLAGARADALTYYDAINGLVIGTDMTVYNHYLNEVIGGTNSFVLQVDDYTDFAGAIKDKIIKEVTIPEPATLLLLGLGLLGIVPFRRRT